MCCLTKATNGSFKFGYIVKMTKCYVWVEDSDEVQFKKSKRNVVPATKDELNSQKSMAVHVDDGPIKVGTTISCVFGVHAGTVAVVTGATKCFHKFQDKEGRTRKVAKQYARRVVITTPSKKRKLA